MTWFLYSNMCLWKIEFSLQKITLLQCECWCIVKHTSEQKEVGVGERGRKSEKGKRGEGESRMERGREGETERLTETD